MCVYRPTEIWSLSPFPSGTSESNKKMCCVETNLDRNTANMLHEAMRRNEVIKIQYVPFQPVTCLDSMLGMITNGLLSGPYLYICGRACASVSRCTLDLFGCRGNSVREAGLQSRRRSPGPCARRASARPAITCTQTRQCAVWCCQSGSVWGSCTCLVRLSCSRRGWRRWPFSCSRPGRWPTPSSEPGNTQRGKHLRGLQTNLPSFILLSTLYVRSVVIHYSAFKSAQSHRKFILIVPKVSLGIHSVLVVASIMLLFFPKAHWVTFQRHNWREKTHAEVYKKRTSLHFLGKNK